MATTRKARVFVSFDFDNDRVMRDFMVGQAKLPDSPFEIVDCSLKEAAPEKDWLNKARRAILGSDMVIVIVGPKTHNAPGVLKEIAVARELDIPIYQVIGYKDGDYTPVPGGGRLHRWSWDNLKNLFEPQAKRL